MKDAKKSLKKRERSKKKEAIISVKEIASSIRAIKEKESEDEEEGRISEDANTGAGASLKSIGSVDKQGDFFDSLPEASEALLGGDFSSVGSSKSLPGPSLPVNIALEQTVSQNAAQNAADSAASSRGTGSSMDEQNQPARNYMEQPSNYASVRVIPDGQGRRPRFVERAEGQSSIGGQSSMMESMPAGVERVDAEKSVSRAMNRLTDFDASRLSEFTPQSLRVAEPSSIWREQYFEESYAPKYAEGQIKEEPSDALSSDFFLKRRRKDI